MRKREVSNGVLLLYDSIKNLPVVRYRQMNRFLAQKNGIGSDLNAVNQHYSRFDMNIAVKDWEALKQERINLQYCLNAIFNDIDLQSRPFLCMVNKIGDHLVGDIDDESEFEKCGLLMAETGVTIGDVEDVFDEIKKYWTGS